MEQDRPGGSKYYQEIAEARIEAQRKRAAASSQPFEGSDFGSNSLNEIARAHGLTAETPNNGGSSFPHQQLGKHLKGLNNIK